MALSRRRFIGSLSAALGAGALGMRPLFGHGMPGAKKAAVGSGPLIGTARNLIFIHLNGGASHVDMLDLKTGSWTPDALGPGKIKGYLDWPLGTMPQLAELTDKFTLVRGFTTQETVHDRGIYQLLTSQQDETDSRSVVPHFGALLSFLRTAPPGSLNVLPFAACLYPDNIGNGTLPSRYKLTEVQQDGSISGSFDPNWPGLDDRLHLIRNQVTANLTEKDPRKACYEAREQAINILKSDRIAELNLDVLPELDEPYKDRYTRHLHGAARILNLNLGTHVLFTELPDWDHHVDIYKPGNPKSLPTLSAAFDHAMAHLIGKLEDTPSPTPGVANLLAETLIVATSEFGRVPGELGGGLGRDHWPHASTLFLAGGGIRGGEILGVSDEDGAYILDPGWNRDRYIEIPDLLATIASALGIDWHYDISTRNGRRFSIVEASNGRPAEPLVEVFNG